MTLLSGGKLLIPGCRDRRLKGPRGSLKLLFVTVTARGFQRVWQTPSIDIVQTDVNSFAYYCMLRAVPEQSAQNSGQSLNNLSVF